MNRKVNVMNRKVNVRNRKATRKSLGQSMTELVVGLIVAVPVLLALVDCSIVVSGAQLGDANGLEAARIAASGDPNSSQQRVDAYIVKANSRLKGMVSDFRLDTKGLETSPANVGPEIQVLQEYGGLVRGTVTVRTKVNVTPFLVRIVYNGNRPLVLSSQHSFPFTYIVPRQKPVD